jgi:hypothetical protein
MKKFIFSGLAALLIAVSIWFAYAAHEQHLPLLEVNNLIQIIPADSATSRTLSWQNKQNDGPVTLEYREAGRTTITQVKPEEHSIPAFRPQEVEQTMNSAYLSGLNADTDYEYRLTTGKKASDWKTFRTTPQDLDHFKVLIFGDSQAADYSVWGNTAKAGLKQLPDASFFINMGDIVDNGQDNSQWRQWFSNAKPLLDIMPFAPVLGNHEAYSLDWKVARPDSFISLFAVPENGPAGQKRLAYSFDYGNVHFVSLNTDYQEISEWYPTLVEDETTWLDADLATARKAGKRIIVLMHRTMWTFRSGEAYDINGEHFGPLFDKYHVSIVFLAHIHSYSRTNPRRDNHDDPQGTVYITTGRSGEKFWSGSYHKSFDEVFYNPTDMTMFLTLEVLPDHFKVSAFKVDGTLIDSAEI